MRLNADHLQTAHEKLVDDIVAAYHADTTTIEQSLKEIGDFYGEDYAAGIVDDLTDRGFVHLSHGWRHRDDLTVTEARDLDLELRYA